MIKKQKQESKTEGEGAGKTNSTCLNPMLATVTVHFNFRGKLSVLCAQYNEEKKIIAFRCTFK